MDVDAAPQTSLPHAITESVPPIPIPATVPTPQAEPPPEIAQDVAVDAVLDDDDEDGDNDAEPNDDNDNDAVEPHDEAADDVLPQPAPVPPTQRLIQVRHIDRLGTGTYHHYHLPLPSFFVKFHSLSNFL